MERADGRHMLWRRASEEQRIWILPDTNPSAPIAAVIPFDMHVAQRVEAVWRGNRLQVKINGTKYNLK